jgi:hypothetical protein
LNRFLETITPQELSELYSGGLTKEFFNRFRVVTYRLPTQPGMRQEFGRLMGARDLKIYIRPNKWAASWHRGQIKHVEINHYFWKFLIERLLVEGMTPVIEQDFMFGSFDALNDCIHVPNYKLLDKMAIMRNCCVLDVFSGLSRRALAARAPFLSVTERELYFQVKDYELDDLCGQNIPYNYIFSFATMIEGGDYINLVDNIIVKLKKFMPTIDLNKLPSTLESSSVAPYVLVKERKAKKFGIKFFKI